MCNKLYKCETNGYKTNLQMLQTCKAGSYHGSHHGSHRSTIWSYGIGYVLRCVVAKETQFGQFLFVRNIARYCKTCCRKFVTPIAERWKPADLDPITPHLIPGKSYKSHLSDGPLSPFVLSRTRMYVVSNLWTIVCWKIHHIPRHFLA